MSEQDTELAELVRQGQVGNPKRDPITGALTNQHLGSSDVSKTVRPSVILYLTSHS